MEFPSVFVVPAMRILLIICALAVACLADRMPQDVESGTYTYQVSILEKKNQTNHICSGALLSSRWIITAAACGKNSSERVISVGSREISNGFKYEIEKIVIHKMYNPDTGLSNVAMWKTKEEIKEVDGRVQYVNLATKELDYDNSTSNKLSGWMLDKTPTLQYVDIDITTIEKCHIGLVQPKDAVDSSILCSSDSRKIDLYKDLGAPLVRRKHLVGVRISEIANVTYYRFVDVYQLKGWIDECVANKKCEGSTASHIHYMTGSLTLITVVTALLRLF